MKQLLILITFIAGAVAVNAQTVSGSGTSRQKKIVPSAEDSARKQRGTGQTYGSRDTTPGSPMGTGGAGGDMSGSPAASAIETDDQTSKAMVQKDTVANQSAVSEKATNRKRRTTHTHYKIRKNL